MSFHFIQVTKTGEFTPIYVNADLITQIIPNGISTIIRFERNHSLYVKDYIKDILDRLVRQERRPAWPEDLEPKA